MGTAGAGIVLPGCLAQPIATDGGLNHLVQDLGLRSLARPPHPDIVVIAVDDRSITSIGRWPWRRALHAQLVDVVSAQNPKAIGLDILFSEPDLDYPLDDALLAQTLARSQRVVLPVLQRNQAGLMEATSELPLDVFADAAAALGHVHVAPMATGWCAVCTCRRARQAHPGTSSVWRCNVWRRTRRPGAKTHPQPIARQSLLHIGLSGSPS